MTISETQFRAFIHASFEIVYRMSADWGQMQLLTGKDLLEDTLIPTQAWLQRYIPQHTQAGVMAAVEAACQNQDFFDLEHEVYRADGTIDWVHSHRSRCWMNSNR